MIIPDWIFQVLAAGGGGAAIAFALFKYFGESWVKHQLDKDLESAKSEISIHAAQRLRLHDKEYEVFPEIWSRLNRVKESLADCLLEFRTLPDLGKMTEDEYKEWLAVNDFNSDELQALTEAGDRIATLTRLLDLRNLKKAGADYHDFQLYLQENRIFIHPEIREQLLQIDALLRQVWSDKKIDFRTDSGQIDHFIKALETYDHKVKPLIEDIENTIQQKLFPVTE